MDQRQEAIGRGELGARQLDIAVQLDDRADQRAVTPQRERIAVGVEQIGQRLELVPLVLIVPGLPLARVRALAGGLDFDETDQRLLDVDGEIGPGAQFGQGFLADQRQRAFRQADFQRECGKQLLKRIAQLILGLPALTELRLG